jgi:galactokinase
MESRKRTSNEHSLSANYTIPNILKKYIQPGSIISRSPGRINLIGEHADYNSGYVLPAAIDKAAWVVLTPRQDAEIHLTAADLDETFNTTVDSMEHHGSHSWPSYVLGVVEEFRIAGFTPRGFDLALSADIPIGAGLSSSAAVECATAFALNELTGAGLSRLQIVQLGQRAENNYVGMQCGIMDQFASVFGKAGHVIRLDCRSLEYAYVPFNTEGVRIVLLDTQVKHSLVTSEYNVRRKQCEQGVHWIQQGQRGVYSLRDANMELLDKYVLPQDTLVYQRCRYVVEEIERLLAACEDLERGDLPAFGQKMYATHDGLSNLYEVSCPELDFLVSVAKTCDGVLGARMMGGGFGGCTINLVREADINSFIEKASAAYTNDLGLELKAYIANIENGSCLVAQ